MNRIIIFLLILPQLVMAGSTPSNPKVLLASVLLPGAGEYLLGNKKVAYSMFAAEALIWTGYFSFKWYGNRITDNYRMYASEYAGAYSGATDDDYWDAVEWYVNAEEYNRSVREEARELYPDDWEAQQRYIDEHSYTGSLAWDWNNYNSQYGSYRSMRVDARQMFQNASFVAIGAIVNRVVSLAWTFNSLRNLPISGEVEPDLRFSPNSWQVGFKINGVFK
ncbi:MAG: hypothetical protein ACP5FK_06935 [bacterium]